MERLYDEIKSDFDNSLKSNFEIIINQNQFPFSNEEFPENCYVTFFASNQDLKISKKKLSNYKLSHPTLKFNYSLERFPDFHETKKIIYSDIKNNTQSIASMKPMFLFSSELETKWRDTIISRIHYWINTLFSQTLKMYEDKYSITLAFLMLEVYIDNPDNMFITKLPTFEDLIFVSSSNRKELINNDDFIKQFAEMIKNSPFFQR